MKKKEGTEKGSFPEVRNEMGLVGLGLETYGFAGKISWNILKIMIFLVQFKEKAHV